MSNLTIDSKFVGVPWKEETQQISWRDTTNFAASLSDMNPYYMDDARTGGICAPPTFPVKLCWRIILAGRANYIDMPYPQEVWDTLMHYTEYIEIDRLIKPPVQILIKTEISAMLPQRAGTQIVHKQTVTDMDGKPFHTEYIGSMLRDVECPDGGKGSLPEYQKTKYTGKPIWEAPIFINPELPYIYDGCNDLVFAIHTSPKFARSVGLPSNVLHGSANLALGIREVINHELGGDPTRVKAIGGKFTAMVLPGNNVKVQLFERKAANGSVELFWQLLNETTGKVAVSYGYLKATV